MAEKKLLLGDEAIALGAIHAGISGVYAYPGTPSTEITEFIQNNPLAKERNCTALGVPMKNGHGGCIGYVIRRKTCFGMYETCRHERGCRCVCQFCHNRRERWSGGAGCR